MKRTAFAAAVVLSAPLMLATAPAFAADAPSTEQFVNNVAISDMFEVQAGRLAADQAQLDAVQAFGKRMVEDHSKTTDQLKSLVSDNGIKAELPTALDDKHQSKLDKLKDLSGTQFDKTYIDGQVQAHEKAVNMFQAYSDSGDNQKLKQWAGTHAADPQGPSQASRDPAAGGQQGAGNRRQRQRHHGCGPDGRRQAGHRQARHDGGQDGRYRPDGRHR